MRFELLPFSPEIIQARWELGKLPSEDLPGLAQDALELGFDGKYTRRIAGLIKPNASDVQPLMAGFLAELGIRTIVSPQEAALVLTGVVARSIMDGTVPPYEGARFIWRDIVNEVYPNNAPGELLPFVGLASEFEDCDLYGRQAEKARRKIEQEIIARARGLVQGQ